MPAHHRNVAVLVETSRGYGRGLLRGITRFHREHGHWSICFRTHALGDPAPAWLAEWKGDGILARIDNMGIAKRVLATGLPAVDLRGAISGLRLPVLGVDNRIVAQMAFEHLRDLGLRTFAFCGARPGQNPYDDEREIYFQQAAGNAGFSCASFDSRRGAADWNSEQKRIAKWLIRLPKPVGLMTHHDERGQQVLEACRLAGLRVPDQVAVIGVDNDEILCSLSIPSMTSIDTNSERNGYEAAVLLDSMMRRQKPAKQLLLFPPRGIVTRQSTDVIALEDPEVATVVRYLRTFGCNGITVEDALSQVPVSRSTLTRKFKHYLERTPQQELTRVQVSRAQQLLLETDLPMSVIAERCGFSEAKYFIEVFHQQVGITPLRFRKNALFG